MKNNISESKIRATFTAIFFTIIWFILVKKIDAYTGSLIFLIFVEFLAIIITVFNILAQLVLRGKSNLETGFYVPLIISFSIGGYMFLCYKNVLIFLLGVALPIGILVLMGKSNFEKGFYVPLIISFSIGGYMFLYYKNVLILLLGVALPIGIFFFLISLVTGFLLSRYKK
jgi:hypothetical protein